MTKRKRDDKSIYQVWLDDDKMCRYRQAYRQAKDRNQLITIGPSALLAAIWTQPHKAKAFGDYFVKRAVKADIPVAEANEAMARFLAKGNICYEAFDGYCRERQQEAEQEQESYQKNLDRLNKKFAPADADAQS